MLEMVGVTAETRVVLSSATDVTSDSIYIHKLRADVKPSRPAVRTTGPGVAVEIGKKSRPSLMAWFFSSSK